MFIYILLGIAVVLLIITALTLVFTVHVYHSATNEAYFAHEQWKLWESRWYEAQAIVADELHYHMSPSGLNTTITLKKHKE